MTQTFRLIGWERDEETGARSIFEIFEFELDDAFQKKNPKLLYGWAAKIFQNYTHFSNEMEGSYWSMEIIIPGPIDNKIIERRPALN